MNAKSKKNKAIITVVLLLFIIGLVNIVSVRIFERVDLTSDGIYTLSDASKDLVGSLDDRLTIKVYFSEDVPTELQTARRMLIDLLYEYKAYSNGNLYFEFFDPEGEEEFSKAEEEGVYPVQIQVRENDKLEVKKAFLNMLIMYEDRKENYPLNKGIGNIEYDLSSIIKRLIDPVKKQIGFTQGYGETPMEQMQLIHKELSQQYELYPVDLKETQEVPEDINVLVLIDPKERYSDTAKYAIDQFLMKGGKLAVFSGKYNADINAQTPYTQPGDWGLDDMLANYGIRINTDIIRDASCASISVQRQQGNFIVNQPVRFPLLVQAQNLNEESVLVKNINNLIFPFTSSIDTSLAGPAGIKAEVIARSSEASARQSGVLTINPFQEYTETDFPEDNIPIAATFTGSFKSFFEGKVPAPAANKSPETIIAVAGTGKFISDDIVQSGAVENYLFFSNMISYLADDTGLISIRAKNMMMPLLEEVSDGTRRMLKWGNMLVPPAIVILFGLFRWRKKLSIKRTIESQL